MQFNGIKSYILDNEFKIIILNNKINITNYLEMGHFDNNKVIVRYLNQNKEKTLVVNGKNLIVSRLKIKEVLVEGNINNIEFRWYYFAF